MSKPRSKKRFTAVLRTVLIVFISLIIGINVYLWNAKTLTGNALPMPFGYGASIVLTGSMEPVLSADDLIFVKEQATYAVGDIVVYQDGNVPVVHRIIDIDGETVVTRGDANNAADEPIARSDIKGAVIGHLGGVGGVVRVLKSAPMTVILLVAAVVLLELSYRKERSRDNQDIEKIKEEIRRLKDGME